MGLKCGKCKKLVKSRKDVSVGYWWSTQLPFVESYHIKCFGEIRSKTIGAITPSYISPDKLTSLKVVNYAVLFMLFLITLLLPTAYVMRGADGLGSDLFNLGLFDILAISFSFGVLFIIVYASLRSLMIIDKVEMLKK